MRYFLSTLTIFFALASADISLQVFSDSDCTGTSLDNIHSNAANPSDNSNCISTNQFQSARVVSTTKGFKCNVYQDSACQNFLESFETAICGNVIGSSVDCFNQALVDNPLAESTAAVTLGTHSVVANVNLFNGQPNSIQSIVSAAINSACGDKGYDSGNKAITKWEHLFNCPDFDGRNCDVESCTQTVAVSGNYDNPNQRDYMSAILETSGKKTESTANGFRTNGIEAMNNVMNFASVVLNDLKGSNQAQMSFSIDVECKSLKPSAVDCGNLKATVTTSILSAIPAVGGLLAGLFTVSCQLASGG